MKYLGIDFGLKRVGLATSEGILASPWKVIEGKGVDDLVKKISQLAENFDKAIVGLPEGKIGEVTKKFIKKLQGLGVDVVATDETLSTKTAQKLMIDMGYSKKKRATTDAHAAAQILQSYLDKK